MSDLADLAWLAGELSAIRTQLLPSGESPALYLALDQGGTRAARCCSTPSAANSRPRTARSARDAPATDRVEHDAASSRSRCRSQRRTCASTDLARARPIAAAGLATQRSTIVCWDRDSGRAAQPGASPGRIAATPRGWRRTLGSRARWVREHTGLPLSPHYGASKLRWCLDHLPRCGGRARGRARGGTARELPAVRTAARAARRAPTRPTHRARCCSIRRRSTGRRSCSTPSASPRAMLPELRRHAARLRHAGRSAHAACRCAPAPATSRRRPLRSDRPVETAALVNVGTGAFVQRVADGRCAAAPGLLRSVLRARRRAARSTATKARSTAPAARSSGCAEQVALDVDRALRSLPADWPAGEPPLFMNGVGGLGAPFWKPDFPIEFVGARQRSDCSCTRGRREHRVPAGGQPRRRCTAAAPLMRISISGGLALRLPVPRARGPQRARRRALRAARSHGSRHRVPRRRRARRLAGGAGRSRLHAGRQRAAAVALRELARRDGTARRDDS